MEQRVLSSTYDPQRVEEKWYEYWVQGDFFCAGKEEGKNPYTIVIPPPNVTGNLHIGHALNNTLHDILIRFKRMQGYDTLWLPGMDHAGISTQARVEAKLREEGISRYDVGREKFVNMVWEWKEEYSRNIRNQWKKMGLSLDYSRERFTLDEGLSHAVKEVFVRLYEKGLIYRGKYIINWDPSAKTALSDIEVIHKDIKGALYHLRYPLKDGSGFIQVATTRPETMLGDVAVAVHPEDVRYASYIGKEVILPIVGREIPVIADDFVDPSFGSGAVKITPAHDHNDFEMGLRHDLPQIVVMDESGMMNDLAEKYQGLDRFQCREQIVADLQSSGVLVEIEDHVHSVGHSERSGAVVEPYLSTQWFVSMKPLAERAIQIQKEQTGVQFVPDRFEKIYLHWIENVKDWCISRQLWWGHRIPAWYCEDCQEMIVTREEPVACTSCQGTNLRQEEDVLDTWFSSALWPFSTLGWPEETVDMKKYYPTDVLLTGYDIIYFWVARMIFTALEFTDQKPFKDVLITGLVRDAEGRKMSKSLGNGIDPMEVIEKYGTDALRFTLSTGCTPGSDQRFRWERVENSRHFANKIWNASRFTLMHVKEHQTGKVDREQLSVADRWILHRLNETISDVTRLLEGYDFGEAGRLLYQFIWNDLCDWYIEFAKIPLYGEDEVARERTCEVLVYVLDHALRLLHPMMPFITEEIWQNLPVASESIMISEWPQIQEDHVDHDSVHEMSVLIELIHTLRNLRAEMEVAPKKQINLYIRPDAKGLFIEKHQNVIKKICNIETLISDPELVRPGKSMAMVITGAELFVPLDGLGDVEQTIIRLQKELKKLDGELIRVEKLLSNEKFIAKAPATLIQEEKQKGQDYKEKREKVASRLHEIQGV